MMDDPLMFAMDLTRERNVKLYDVIQQLLLPDHIGNALRDLRTKCWTSEGSKYKTYVQINPDLEVHKTYTKCVQSDLPIPEHTRVAFSRMRLGLQPLSGTCLYIYNTNYIAMSMSKINLMLASHQQNSKLLRFQPGVTPCAPGLYCYRENPNYV